MALELLLKEDGGRLLGEAGGSGFFVLESSEAPPVGVPFGDSSLRTQTGEVRPVVIDGSLYTFAFDPNLTAYGRQGVWASEARIGYYQNLMVAVEPDTGYYGENRYITQMVPWRLLEQKYGLRLQVRFALLLYQAAPGGVADAYIAWHSVDSGDALGAGSANLGALTAVTASAVTYESAVDQAVFVVRDSGWCDLDPGYEVKDFILFIYQVQKVGGWVTQTYGVTVFFRWVG